MEDEDDDKPISREALDRIMAETERKRNEAKAALPEKIAKPPAHMECVSCGKECKIDQHWLKFDKNIGIVYGALFCKSYGNYGSTKYDPMTNDEHLLFILCDECLEKKGDKIYRIRFVDGKTRRAETFAEHKENQKKAHEAKQEAKQEALDKGMDERRAGIEAWNVFYDNGGELH